MPLRPFRKRAPKARQVAAGRAVRELFERHGRMVHAVCRLNLRDPLDAEDATQQTFLSAYRSLLGGNEPTNPPAWLATIARNECSNVRSRQLTTVPIGDSEAAEALDVPTAVEQREEVDALAAAVSELTPSQRDAVVLREFYGLSYAEVAAVLGVSGPAVESLLFKGRKQLQEKLGSLRVASVVVLPETVRDALVQLLPGFGGAAATAKMVAIPAAAKIAVAAAVVTGGGVAVSETVRQDSPRPVESRVSATNETGLERAGADEAGPPHRALPIARVLNQVGEQHGAEQDETEPEDDLELDDRDEKDDVGERDDRDEKAEDAEPDDNHDEDEAQEPEDDASDSEEDGAEPQDDASEDSHED